VRDIRLLRVDNGPLVQGGYAEVMDALDRAGDLLPSTPWLRGAVAAVSKDGKVATVKLDEPEPGAQPGMNLAIHAGGRYQGEFVIATVEGGYVLGRMVRLVEGVRIAVGDRVDSSPGRDHEAVDLAEVTRRIDAAMAALQHARAELWQQGPNRARQVEPATAAEMAERETLRALVAAARWQTMPAPLPIPRAARAAFADFPACRQRLRTAGDRNAALAALDCAAKALMAAQRALPK
jgi:hypothetical protein